MKLAIKHTHKARRHASKGNQEDFKKKKNTGKALSLKEE